MTNRGVKSFEAPDSLVNYTYHPKLHENSSRRIQKRRRKLCVVHHVAKGYIHLGTEAATLDHGGSNCDEKVGYRTFRLRNSASIFGFSFLKLAFGGMRPFSRIITALMTPATPLAPSKCPTLDSRAPLQHVSNRVIKHYDFDNISHEKRLIGGPKWPKDATDSIGVNWVSKRSASS